MGKLNSQEQILLLIDTIKQKTTVSITDLEQYEQLLMKVERDLQELKDSRDMWKARCKEYESNEKTIKKVDGWKK